MTSQFVLHTFLNLLQHTYVPLIQEHIKDDHVDYSKVNYGFQNTKNINFNNQILKLKKLKRLFIEFINIKKNMESIGNLKLKFNLKKHINRNF